MQWAARRVQQKLFLKELPRAPGWDLAALCRAARMVSGDYCDLFEVAGGQIAIALGDVCGKGLGPALLTASLHALIRGQLHQLTPDLGRCLQDVNAYLLANTPADMFVTLFLGILDLEVGSLRYVNAGHPAPFVLATGNYDPDLLVEGGLPLGIQSDVHYTEGRVCLGRGDTFALFSDGLTEAKARTGECFQRERVAEVVRAARSLPATVICDGVLEASERFTGLSKQKDDVSLIVIQRQDDSEQRS